MGRETPAIAVSSVRTQEAVIAAQTVRERLLAILGAFFGLVALVLSAVGLYGVADYLVVQRRRDIGICLALGAPTTRVARMVASGIVAMVALGGGVGLLLGLGSERYLAALLFGVTATDAAALAAPAGIVLVVTASRVPAPILARLADRHHGDDPARSESHGRARDRTGAGTGNCANPRCLDLSVALCALPTVSLSLVPRPAAFSASGGRRRWWWRPGPARRPRRASRRCSCRADPAR